MWQCWTRIFVISWLMFISVDTARAAPGQITHALAMHGAPKYAPDFQHFDYVNPNAPKGGTL
ncbi:MAG: hypothetical protein E2O37_07445, partial [Proteobacteria bacterium]